MTEKEIKYKFPQVIILYGPPNAGKGTQAHFLSGKLPEYYHLDFGGELRKFVAQTIGDIKNPIEEAVIGAKRDDIEVALRLKADMKNSLPVQTSDLRYVIEHTINSCIEKGKGMIVEGPGRLVEEAEWLSGFLSEKKVETIIFHLYIAIEEVLERSSKRFYIPNSKKPYINYEEALKDCKQGEKPYRRPEDEDVEGTKQRYRLLYSDHFAEIISIYQLKARSLVFNLDASKTIEQVSDEIQEYFRVFYGKKL